MKIYKITRASEYLGVSINTLKTLANNGKIKSFKTTGKHRRFRQEDMEGIIDSVPAFPSVTIKDSTPRTSLTIDEQEMALLCIPEEHRDIYIFGTETGLRSGELGALKLKDINANARTIKVQRTFLKSGKLHESTKENTKLPVPLSDTACKVVMRNIKGKGIDDFLFVSKNGKPYTPQRLYKIWRYWRSQEFKEICVHELIRHSFCSQVAEIGGLTDMDSMRLMRHADIRTTQNYTHNRSMNKLREIVNRRKVG